jgi:hypothetical protein
MALLMSTTLRALQDVLDEHSNLTIDGLVLPWKTAAPDRRAALLAHASQFECAVAWLSLVPKRKAVSRGHGYSYTIKHVIQRWAGEYVSNGATIAAALHLGFPVLQCPATINAWIGVEGRRKWPTGRL